MSLKGRTYDQRHYSNKQRDASEAEFFATASYAQLSNECKEAENLKTRLINIFYRHTVDLLPSLRNDTETYMHKLHAVLESSQARRTLRT
jgi:hypothetical protein